MHMPHCFSPYKATSQVEGCWILCDSQEHVEKCAKEATPSCTLCRVITLGRSGNEGISKLMATGVEPRQSRQDTASMNFGKPDQCLMVFSHLFPLLHNLTSACRWPIQGRPAVGQPGCFESVETRGSWLETPLFAALKLPPPLDAIRPFHAFAN